jgi:hypothetical protein
MKSAGLVPLKEYPEVHTPWKSRCMKCEKVASPYFVSCAEPYWSSVISGFEPLLGRWDIREVYDHVLMYV